VSAKMTNKAKNDEGIQDGKNQYYKFFLSTQEYLLDHIKKPPQILLQLFTSNTFSNTSDAI
jgi:hypothetical protein